MHVVQYWEYWHIYPSIYLWWYYINRETRAGQYLWANVVVKRPSVYLTTSRMAKVSVDQPEKHKGNTPSSVAGITHAMWLSGLLTSAPISKALLCRRIRTKQLRRNCLMRFIAHDLLSPGYYNRRHLWILFIDMMHNVYLSGVISLITWVKKKGLRITTDIGWQVICGQESGK